MQFFTLPILLLTFLSLTPLTQAQWVVRSSIDVCRTGCLCFPVPGNASARPQPMCLGERLAQCIPGTNTHCVEVTPPSSPEPKTPPPTAGKENEDRRIRGAARGRTTDQQNALTQRRRSGSRGRTGAGRKVRRNVRYYYGRDGLVGADE